MVVGAHNLSAKRSPHSKLASVVMGIHNLSAIRLPCSEHSELASIVNAVNEANSHHWWWGPKTWAQKSLHTSNFSHAAILAMQWTHRVPTDQGNQEIQGNVWKLFPVREIREKQGFFRQNQGKKFQIRELFFQTIFKPFKPINLRKMFFKTVKPQELSGNYNICID